jgi:hypothetical protein
MVDKKKTKKTKKGKKVTKKKEMKIPGLGE